MVDAYEIPGKRYTYLSTGDLSTAIFHAVKLSGTGKRIVKCVADERIIGVLQNKPVLTDDAATVMVDGVTKAVAGAAITVGQRVKPNAAGRFIPVSASEPVAGQAETAAAADGELFTLRIAPTA